MKRASSKRWIIRQSDKAASQALVRSLGISPVIADLLAARGITEAEEVRRLLHPSFERLHDPLLMLGMKKAVERIGQAIERDEPILIYGDYDVDGTTGTVVLRRVLQLIGARRTGYFIPHRFTDGYGIHQQALEKAQQDGYKLIISVDCGIRAYAPLIWAQKHGLDCIVTDHHLADDERGAPPAYAVLNPNQPGCPYPDKNLAGVGVAFKLAHALLRERRQEHLSRGFLKVVAIGTVADVAPLVGENRIIVSLGLADLPRATNLGLRALMRVAGCCEEDGSAKKMLASDLGFRIGPRINAAGRMDAARAVVELFEAASGAEAERLASHLDSRNRDRQSMQREITERAILELDSLDSAHAHVAIVSGDGWHRGVIGLAASKILERTGRPAIVISCDGEFGHGSARSIETYHLLDGLTACADLFEQFGGHAHAAGLLIKRANIPELRRRLNAHAAERLTEDDLIPVVQADAMLQPEAITLQLCEELQQLEPFGANWHRPVFITKNLRLASPVKVLKERHLKLHLQDQSGQLNFEALWWGAAETIERTPVTGERIELAYELETNTWRNQTRLQLKIEDLRITG